MIGDQAQDLLAGEAFYINNPQLKQADGRAALKDLNERGFVLARADDGNLRMFAANGELLLGSSEGIVYHFYFGKTLPGPPQEKGRPAAAPAAEGERIYMLARAAIQPELAEAADKKARDELLNRTNDRLGSWLAQADRNYYIISKATYDALMPAQERLVVSAHPADLPGGPGPIPPAPAANQIPPVEPPRPR